MSKIVRRKYSKQFKSDAVNLVTQQGYTIAEASRNLGIQANMLGRWKRDLLEDSLEKVTGTGNTKELQAEVKRLQKENQRLKMEREILKKAAAFFAKESE